MNDIATPATVEPRASSRTSLVVRMAERFGVEATRLMDTLKATAFKTDKPISNESMMGLLVVAEQYHLNPFTRELFAFLDKNGGIVPFVSIDGWSRIINEHPMFDGLEFAWQVEDDQIGLSCICTIWRKDRSHPMRITEYLAECKRGTQPWSTHPRRMLRHKTLIQCARLAFGFAGLYDEDEARRIVEQPALAEVDVVEPARLPTAAIANEPAQAARAAAAKRRAEKAAATRASNTAAAAAEEAAAATQSQGEGPPAASEPAAPQTTPATTSQAMPSPADVERITRAIENSFDRDMAAEELDAARTMGWPEATLEQLAQVFRARWPG